MTTDTDSFDAPEPHYEGLFGTLCKHVPLFDARAPDGWMVTYRGWTRTIWYHVEYDVTAECSKQPDGWTVSIRDERTGSVYETLPRDTSRFKAYDAARQFLEEEDPLLVDHDAKFGDEWDGPLTLEKLRDAR